MNAYDGEVRTVVFLGRKAVLHNPLISSEVLTTIARIVAFTPTAVHQLLLRQPHELLRLQRRNYLTSYNILS